MVVLFLSAFVTMATCSRTPEAALAHVRDVVLDASDPNDPFHQAIADSSTMDIYDLLLLEMPDLHSLTLDDGSPVNITIVVRHLSSLQDWFLEQAPRKGS